MFDVSTFDASGHSITAALGSRRSGSAMTFVRQGSFEVRRIGGHPVAPDVEIDVSGLSPGLRRGFPAKANRQAG
ncbi:hypothetical protein GQ57_12565 [Burkholderia sp. MSh2]|uniref:Uncharacterized protein n=2 Tax=Burkholderiaceae TaxID=119060 RepID=A0A6J5DQE5_9BURK|nr:hypothetical protein GQ57_12565 [Burkholderia sp. MSh2]CAB3755372.1 hypothetical protein LMG30113_02449 [Burkholderia paludis]VWB35956.1 hypothetical protein BPA30113_01441 [Burkholderia paludis]